MLGFSFSPTQKIPGFYLRNLTSEMVLGTKLQVSRIPNYPENGNIEQSLFR